MDLSSTDLLALPYIIAMHDAGATFTAAGKGWLVTTSAGEAFQFNEEDLCNGLSVVKERFVDNELDGFEVRDALVIDIGAHFGDSAVWFAKQGAKQIVAYEPFPTTAAVAAVSIRLNRLESRVKLNVLGVGGQNSRLQVPYDRRLSSTQSARVASEGGVLGESTQVDIVAFADVVTDARTEGRTGNLAIKIDCEGCEEDIFAEPESWHALSLANRLVIEWHRSETLPGFLEQLRAVRFNYTTRATPNSTVIILADRIEPLA